MVGGFCWMTLPSEFFSENQKKMKLLIFLICESLAGLKSSAGNIKVQEECNVNIRKSRAKVTHVGTSSQDGISSNLNIRGPWLKSPDRNNAVFWFPKFWGIYILDNAKKSPLISESYQQAIPAEIFQLETFGMISNRIKINRSKGNSASQLNISRFGGFIFLSCVSD